MCYHKSLVNTYDELEKYYSASFATINEEVALLRERYTTMCSRADNESSKEEIAERKWLDKTLGGFTEKQYKRYHENGFDYLATPIITAGAPLEFKLFRWGLIPFYMSDKTKAFGLRPSTLNCISEEMYEKPAFRDAAKNAQRCLIPVTGFYEWQWMDEKGRVKTPFYISLKGRSVVSLAGLYSRWRDKNTGQYYYTYTVLTTVANELMEKIHNSKKRMPVLIESQYEKDWLNKDLTKEDVLAFCRPLDTGSMRAHTISKLITTKDADTNVADVLKIHEWEKIDSK